MSAGTQVADAVLMVRPATVVATPHAPVVDASSSSARPGRPDWLREAVLHEFEQLAALLADETRVHVLDDTPAPPKPESPFAGDWLGTHADGTVVLYPLLAPARRPERRRELVEALAARGPYRVARTLDLSHHESRGEFLEGAGSLVLDRVRRVAYAARSPRAHAAPLAALARALDYEVVAFDALDADGTPLERTGRALWLGERVCALCADAIPDAAQRRALLDRLGAEREVVTLSRAQLAERCGDMLALRSTAGDARLEMSHRGYHALTEPQRAVLRRHFRWLDAHPLYAIERLGGDGVRRLLVEVFLPRA